MKDVLEIFWQLVLAITGAVALSAIAVAGVAFGIGCVAFGCTCTWRTWRKRVKTRIADRD